MKTYSKPTLFDIFNTILIGALAFLCLYPLYFLLINSLSESSAVATGIYLWPKGFTLQAFEEVIGEAGIINSIGISVARTIIGAGVSVGCCSFLAYMLTQPLLPCRKFIYRMVVVTMYLNAGFIPLYLTITNLGLRNNFLVYILPYAISAYYVILIKTYIEGMPKELRESAELDGAGTVRVYLSIVFPLAKPILACIAIFAAVFQWNAWTDDLYFISGAAGANLHCLQFQLYKKIATLSVKDTAAALSGSNSAQSSTTTIRMAMTMITVLPIICVYPFMQRYFVKGIMLGAVKG